MSFVVKRECFCFCFDRFSKFFEAEYVLLRTGCPFLYISLRQCETLERAPQWLEYRFLQAVYSIWMVKWYIQGSCCHKFFWEKKNRKFRAPFRAIFSIPSSIPSSMASYGTLHILKPNKEASKTFYHIIKKYTTFGKADHCDVRINNDTIADIQAILTATEEGIVRHLFTSHITV